MRAKLQAVHVPGELEGGWLVAGGTRTITSAASQLAWETSASAAGLHCRPRAATHRRMLALGRKLLGGAAHHRAHVVHPVLQRGCRHHQVVQLQFHCVDFSYCGAGYQASVAPAGRKWGRAGGGSGLAAAAAAGWGREHGAPLAGLLKLEYALQHLPVALQAAWEAPPASWPSKARAQTVHAVPGAFDWLRMQRRLLCTLQAGRWRPCRLHGLSSVALDDK